jgi:signal transduction histidine kinase
MGYAEILLKRNPPDDVREQWLRNIVESGQQLTDMVDDLLNITRIQSGKLQIRLELIDLADVFEERLDIIRESSDKHEIIVDVEHGLPTVMADREKLGQVVGNLLSNAVKYSPDGGHIILKVRRDPANSRVVVSVSDEGIGIGAEDRDTLFTTFHRIHRSETKGVKGSGLGLYIAKEWIEAMGGEIWLESELNHGSTFFVAVPHNDSCSQQLASSVDSTEDDSEFRLSMD